MRKSLAEPACFALVTLVYLVHLFASGYDTFYYDANEYWQAGKLFSDGGGFSLLSYDYEWRGYSIPLLNHILDSIGGALGMGDVTIVKVFGSLLAATLGVVVLPRLARALFPNAALGWERVLALNALLFLYWRDHFDFPLADFPALLTASVGVIALLRRTTWGYVGAGVALGLAANMRGKLLVRTARSHSRIRTDSATGVELENAKHRGRLGARRRAHRQHAADAHEPPPPRHVEPEHPDCQGGKPDRHLAGPAGPEVRDLRRPGDRLSATRASSTSTRPQESCSKRRK